MDQDNPERRIAELERRLAEQKHVTVRARAGVTPEQVHNVAFSEASRSQGAYHCDEVDAFLARVEATLRDPTARPGVTSADLHEVAFSEPPIGQRGYNEVEVDMFLDLVKIELSRRGSDQGPEEPIRCLLYPYGGRDQQTPVLAIEVAKDVFRVVDLKSNALIASVALAAVVAEPADNGGIPVLVVDGPGLETLTITPHPPPGTWRKRPKSTKPAYLAVDVDWLTLAQIFGLASDLAEESTPQNVREHIFRFFGEGATTRGPTTWRTPLMAGLLVGVPGAIYGSLFAVGIGVVCLILAALAWHFKWEI
jgi:DivIVA domain-containing protein